eukprot:TRINITY_DN8505_c0_g1_i1.p1 TRINITY_DN8505_c0_g1~~TRINITY_DN8505_c0_g1_i1.p1  ORF type:complete len:162 (-),score=23.87 TRINITY_DN8505_c0_g1_i1:562-990(-)
MVAHILPQFQTCFTHVCLLDIPMGTVVERMEEVSSVNQLTISGGSLDNIHMRDVIRIFPAVCSASFPRSNIGDESIEIMSEGWQIEILSLDDTQVTSLTVQKIRDHNFLPALKSIYLLDSLKPNDNSTYIRTGVTAYWCSSW